MFATREYVISELLKTKDFISGEKLSEALGMSRAAINTAVKALRSEGYDITSVTNKGYKLVNKPDFLTAGELLSLLPESRMQTVTVLPEVDSTNKRLKEMAFEGAPEGSVVVSDHQSAGRGRLGRSFLSPQGKGIYLSYLLRPASTPSEISTVTCRAAVATCEAIKNVCGEYPSIKWVNDLQINSMKICGILTEMSIEPEIGCVSNVIIGIGINVNEDPSDFPEELQSIASSIKHELGATVPISRSAITSELIKELDKLRAGWPSEHDYYLSKYKELCSTVGLDLNVLPVGNPDPSLIRQAKAIGISDNFALEVEFADGHTELLSSGEVSVRRR